MKKFTGFEAKKSGGAREILPAGGYVAKILNAEEVSYDWGNVLLISFDILEGDYKDFFATDYKGQNREDELPKLPDRDWCAVMVNTAQKGNPKSRPMIYERAIVRGKRVERWKYYWDRIADELPDYWMPLPAPPDRRPPEGEA